MIFVVTAAATLLAALAHIVGVPLFADAVSIPIAGVIALCVIGFIGRLVPAVRSELVAMVPRALPAPTAIVWITGACELAGALGLLLPTTRLWAALALIVLLVCVFPANVRAAHLASTDEGEVRRLILIRGIKQVALIALCAWIAVATF